jgi:hypothetical protein
MKDCQLKDNQEMIFQVHKVYETPLDTLSFCLEGAIRYAAGCFSPKLGGGRFMALFRQAGRLEMLVLQTAHRDGLTDRTLRLFHFNDDERTSQADAILVLKKALEEVD